MSRMGSVTVAQWAERNIQKKSRRIEINKRFINQFKYFLHNSWETFKRQGNVKKRY